MGTLFYIPEFLSNSRTDKAEVFKALCENNGWRFVPLDWPSYDPTKIYVTFNETMLHSLHNTNNIIVGTGLGAFWANYFAKDFLAKTILINPCVNPSSKLYQFLDEEHDTIKDVDGLTFLFNETMIAKYNLYESLIRSHYGTILYLSKDNPVNDWKIANILFKDNEDVCVRLYPDGGHHMEKHMDDIVIDTIHLMSIPHYLLPHEAEKFRRALTAGRVSCTMSENQGVYDVATQ